MTFHFDRRHDEKFAMPERFGAKFCQVQNGRYARGGGTVFFSVPLVFRKWKFVGKIVKFVENLLNRWKLRFVLIFDNFKGFILKWVGEGENGNFWSENFEFIAYFEWEKLRLWIWEYYSIEFSLCTDFQVRKFFLEAKRKWWLCRPRKLNRNSRQLQSGFLNDEKFGISSFVVTFLDYLSI